MTGEVHATTTARVATARPARYAKQLVSHFSATNEGHWSSDDGRGNITFIGEGAEADNPKKAFDGRIQVSLVAAESTLLIHIEAPEGLIPRFEKVVGSHLVRFGAKDELVVTWRRSDGEPGSEQYAASQD